MYCILYHYICFTGGLASVIYTDTLQSVILVISATVLFILSKSYMM